MDNTNPDKECVNNNADNLGNFTLECPDLDFTILKDDVGTNLEDALSGTKLNSLILEDTVPMNITLEYPDLDFTILQDVPQIDDVGINRFGEVLSYDHKVTLWDVLKTFIWEVRNLNGNEYKSKTIYEIIISIQYYFLNNGHAYNFLTDDVFLPLRKNLDVREDVWFYDAPVGVHSLQMIVSILCKKAGFSGFYTNQLRASDATRLYEAGVEEQLVIESTGHRS